MVPTLDLGFSSTTVGMSRMLWSRNRLTLLIVALYIVTEAVIARLSTEDQLVQFLFSILLIPSIFVCIWLFGEFTMATNTDLTHPSSGFPARLFILPVRTSVLVIVPMIMASIVAVLFWIVLSRLFLRPRGVELPIIWPSTLAASTMAWVQMFSWTSFRIGWIRVVLALMLLTATVSGTIAAVHYEVPAWAISVACLLQLGTAYALAITSVSKARHGSSSSPSLRFERLFNYLEFPLRKVPSSRMAAQVWSEFRLNGLSLPIATIALSFVFVIGAILTDGGGTQMPTRLCQVLVWLPIVLALLSASTISRFQRGEAAGHINLFIATRPISDGELIGAKLRCAAISVGIGFAFAWLAQLMIMLLTEAGQQLLSRFQTYAEMTSVANASVYAVLLVALPPIIAWWVLANHLWLGFTGIRRATWLYLLAIFVTLFLAALIPGLTIGTETTMRFLRANADGVLVFLMLIKTLIGLTLAFRSYRLGVVSPIWLAIFALCWGFAVFAIALAMQRYLLPSDWEWLPIFGMVFMLAPALGALLAPSMLSTNRHRR